MIVATGIHALVDDTIRRRWPPKRRRRSLSLRRKPSFVLDALGPKRLIDEVILRRGSES